MFTGAANAWPPARPRPPPPPPGARDPCGAPHPHLQPPQPPPQAASRFLVCPRCAQSCPPRPKQTPSPQRGSTAGPPQTPRDRCGTGPRWGGEGACLGVPASRQGRQPPQAALQAAGCPLQACLLCRHCRAPAPPPAQHMPGPRPARPRAPGASPVRRADCPLARRRGLPHMYPAAAVAAGQPPRRHWGPVHRVALAAVRVHVTRSHLVHPALAAGRGRRLVLQLVQLRAEVPHLPGRRGAGGGTPARRLRGARAQPSPAATLSGKQAPSRPAVGHQAPVVTAPPRASPALERCPPKTPRCAAAAGRRARG